MRHSCLTGSFIPVKIQTPHGDKIKCVLRQGKLRDFAPTGALPPKDVEDILSHLSLTIGMAGEVLTESGSVYKWSIE